MTLKLFITTIFLLTIISCSDINEVRTDGTRQLNGKKVKSLYVKTDKGIESIKAELIERYGKPKVSPDGGLTWRLKNNVLSSYSITETVYFDSVFHFVGGKKIFDFVTVNVCLTDKDGNDLLTKKSMNTSGQKNLQEIINGI